MSQAGPGETARAALCADRRPVVAQVNYFYFLSTQSFIYFYLTQLRRVRPLCLTRTPESPELARALPPALARDFHLYGGDEVGGRLRRGFHDLGLRMRRGLSHLPPRIASP